MFTSPNFFFPTQLIRPMATLQGESKRGRSKSKELDPTMRARLCELYSIGWGYRRIHGKHPDIAISTIRNTVKMEAKRENQKSLPRPGTPKKLSAEQQRLLIEKSTANPELTYRELQDMVGNIVSKSTIRRLLRDARQKGAGNSSSSGSKTNDDNINNNNNNNDANQPNNTPNTEQQTLNTAGG